MDIVIQLGLLILAPFEKISHGIQWLTGYDNFAQARFLTRLNEVYLLTLNIITNIHQYSQGVSLSTRLAGTIVLLLLYLSCGRVRRILIAHFEKGVQPGFRNPAAVNLTETFVRLWILFVFPLPPYVVTLLPANALFIVETQLTACTPLPPRTGKIREWWNKLKNFSLTESPVPDSAGA